MLAEVGKLFNNFLKLLDFWDFLLDPTCKSIYFLVQMNMRIHTDLAELKAGLDLFIVSGPSLTLSNASKENPVNS
jgi:hypothetical protein